MGSFDEQVRGVGYRGGHAPGDARVVPDDDAGQTRQPSARDVGVARGQVDHVPDSGHLGREVRVVGEQRSAAGRATRRNHPVVAATGADQAGKRLESLGRGRHRDRVEAASALHPGRHRARLHLGRALGPEACDEPGPDQLALPVPGLSESHELGEGEPVFGAPGSGPEPKQRELDRQLMARDVGCHPEAIGIEHLAVIRLQRRDGGLGGSPEAQPAQKAVGRHRRLAQNFRQLAAGDAPV